MSIQTAQVRGRNSGRNNILLLHDLCGPEYDFVDKPHEKQVLYEGHTHRVIRLEKRIRPCRHRFAPSEKYTNTTVKGQHCY